MLDRLTDLPVHKATTATGPTARSEGDCIVSYIAHIVAAKLPTIIGAGILGISFAGAVASVVGLTFGAGAEIVSALAGMTLAGVAVREQR
jgi:hypothetical protein